MLRRVLLVSVFFGLFAGVALAQEPEPVPVPFDYNELIAYFINTFGVFTLVRIITKFGPNLDGTVRMILALAGGPLLMNVLTPYLVGALGYPIDLSTVAAALAGLASSFTAMAGYDFAKLSGGGK